MGMENMGAMPVYEVNGSRNNDGFANSWIWVFFLFFLLAWGGNGFGFGGRGEGIATQADIQRGFDTNTIVNKLDGISNGLCQGFYAANTTMLEGFNGTQAGIANLGYQMQNCCCETNRNIDAVRYENAQNTCAITNAIHAEGEQTRALINANTMQELRDQLQAAQLQLGQLSQTQTLIGELRPCAKPAYITCSPYTTSGFGYGCSCGCNC